MLSTLLLLAAAPAFSENYFLLKDMYSDYVATVCLAKNAGPRKQEELMGKYQEYQAEMVKLVAGGKLTPHELQAVSGFESPEAACRTPEERERQREEAEFFDPANQLRIACLPREERLVILRQRIPEEHRDIMEAYFQRWEERHERLFGERLRELCKTRPGKAD